MVYGTCDKCGFDSFLTNSLCGLCIEQSGNKVAHYAQDEPDEKTLSPLPVDYHDCCEKIRNTLFGYVTGSQCGSIAETVMTSKSGQIVLEHHIIEWQPEGWSIAAYVETDL